jgi:DNA adenine methylase
MQSDHRSYWINDYDVDIAALWQCVAQHPDEPKAAIMKVVPSLPEFDGLKAYFLSRPPMPSDSAELIRMGCGKLALHRMSWSGVGAMGGPLGGRHQSGRQKIDGRWNPVSLCEKIDKITTRSSGVTITSVDYSELILDESRPAILYLDPPYHG